MKRKMMEKVCGPGLGVTIRSVRSLKNRKKHQNVALCYTNTYIFTYV